MNKVFVVYDKLDRSIRKAFDSIHRTEESARLRVEILQQDLDNYARRYVYYLETDVVNLLG